MAEFKVTINDVKSGKSYSKVIKDEQAEVFRNKKVKDKILGDDIGLFGYEFEITGGSDGAGFPIRPDLNLAGRKRILLTKGPGVKGLKKGTRKRKTVVGNILNPGLAQINLKTVKYGSKAIDELLEKKESSS